MYILNAVSYSSLNLIKAEQKEIDFLSQTYIAMYSSMYEKVSDVPESRVWFASKNLTPCRMH